MFSSRLGLLTVAFIASLGFCVGSFQTAQAQSISSVSMLTDPTQTQSYTHVLNISGTGFLKLGSANTPIPVFLAPSPGTGSVDADVLSDSAIEARFAAGADYRINSVVIAVSGKLPLSFVVPPATCTADQILVQWSITPVSQVKDTFGNGLASNYHVIQLTIVDKCSNKIVVPLGGIEIEPTWGSDKKYEKGTQYIAPYGLDHVMSQYNTDRTLTGSRALILNITQAAATIGSAIEPFFAPGFTQGVSIFGGGFRSGMLEILKDMSPQQLKSLSSETFQTTETIGANGNPPVQKFIFVPKKDVKLPSGKRQRIDDIKSLTVTWFTALESTQTQKGTQVNIL